MTWQNTELQNITETYYDTDGRLKTQQIKLERLQKLLAQAENMEDIITIESAISETEWNIEDLSGTLRHYDALVDFATVTVSLQEVYKYSDTEELPEELWTADRQCPEPGLALLCGRHGGLHRGAGLQLDVDRALGGGYYRGSGDCREDPAAETGGKKFACCGKNG